MKPLIHSDHSEEEKYKANIYIHRFYCGFIRTHFRLVNMAIPLSLRIL